MRGFEQQLTAFELFKQIFNFFELLTIVAKFSILDICKGPGYVSGAAEVLIALHNDFTWNSRKVFFIFFYFFEKVLFTNFLVSII